MNFSTAFGYEIVGGMSSSDIDEPVSLSQWQGDWPLRFSAECRRLVGSLDVGPEDLRHIGSTSVPGMLAKPVVDIMLGIPQWPPVERLTHGLESLGYDSFGEGNVPGRYYFRLRSAHEFNVHVVQRDGAHWINNLALRDYLRRSPSACERYAAAKLGAYESGARSLLAYSAAKADVVGQLLREALAKRG